MPKTVNVHPSERVDKIDFEALAGSARDMVASAAKQELLDQRDRIIDGFRVEILDQSQYPGRITIHNGIALDYDGVSVTNEDQPTASRTVFLDGANTTFYVEIEFNEANSDVGARAFWDPTVDQGTDVSGDDLPDGQETSANVSTRKTPDWKVVTPISTAGFQRDQPGNLNSTRIPLVKLRTDGSNEIWSTQNTNLVTEKASTVITRVISTTQVVLKHPRLFVAGQNINVIDTGTGTQASSITSVDYNTGLAVIAAITAPVAGAIVRVTSATAPDFVKSDETGPFRRYEADLAEPDHVVTWQDRMFQGDEVNGRILSQGHANIDARGDVNLASLKDYVDFIAGQLQELKWGARDPFISGTDTARTPPGISVSFPSAPRYFDNAGGVIGSRTAAVTVGDGTKSRGDFNGATQAVLQKAHDSLPASGGRIFLKRGTYILTSDFNWTNSGAVTLEGEEGTVIEVNGGTISINTAGDVKIKTVTIQQNAGAASAQTGANFHTTNPAHVQLEDVRFYNCSFDFNVLFPGTAKFQNLEFVAIDANMVARPLIRAVGVNGVLSGVWSGCAFTHGSFSSVGPCIVDLVTAVPALSASLLDFVDCNVAIFGPLATEGFHIGATVQLVQFTRCKFWATFIGAHVRVTGGQHVKFNECLGTDAIASLVYAENTGYIEVDGYSHSQIAGTGFAAIEIQDCYGVKISNCAMWVNAGLVFSYPSNAGIIIRAQTADVTDVLIENNSIIATTDYVSGIKMDLNGGDIRRARIVNNYTSVCAVGIGLVSTAGSGDFEDISIEGNQFKDGDLGGTATFMKMGIYGAANASFRKINIIGNHIQNCNPNSGLVLIGGTSRQGIIIKGNLSHSLISKNQIRDVGSASALLGNVAGIWVSEAWYTSVSDNLIDGVIGSTSVAGVQLGESPGFASGCKAANNTIKSISADTGDAWGVRFFKIYNSTFTGNIIESILTSSGAYTAAFGVANPSDGEVSQCTFTGNKFNTNDATNRMFLFVVNKVYRLTVTGNECSGGYFSGDEISALYHSFFHGVISIASNRFSYVNISGNVASRGTYGNVLLSVGLGSCSWVSICKNTFHTGGGVNIQADAGAAFTISGNQLYNSGGNAADRNILISNVDKAVIDHNLCSLLGPAVTNTCIELGSGVTKYVVSNNLADKMGAGSGSAIDTSAASGVGIIYGNLSDQVGSWNGEAGVTVGSAHEQTY